MIEHYTYAPVERVVMSTAEFAALRDTAANLEAALLANQEEQAQLRADAQRMYAMLRTVRYTQTVQEMQRIACVCDEVERKWKFKEVQA